MTRTPLQIPQLSADALSQAIGEFQQTGFEVVDRVKEDPFGLQSQIWTYRSTDIQLRVSVDYPYATIHDVATCYRNTGWTVLKEQVLGPLDEGAETYRCHRSAQSVNNLWCLRNCGIRLRPSCLAVECDQCLRRDFSHDRFSPSPDTRGLIDRFRNAETLPVTEDYFQIQMIVLGSLNS